MMLGSEQQLCVRPPLLGLCEMGLLQQHDIQLELDCPQVHELPHLGCAVPSGEEPPHVVRRHPEDGGACTARVGLSHWWWWAGWPPLGVWVLGLVEKE